MNKMNLGCGFDIKDGWLNTNHFSHVPVDGAALLDAREEHPEMIEKFDFILINHVLCTMIPDDVNKVLRNVKKWLKPDGIVHIIDMDIMSAVALYEDGNNDFPVTSGSIDYNFLMHVSGFGTRLSLFTEKYLAELLSSVGFVKIRSIPEWEDEYDTRKKESLRMEATK